VSAARERLADRPAEAAARPTFVLRLQATKPGSSIRGLRWVLKALGRAHGFRCLRVGLDREQR
jgi:hypothetical protein